MGPEGLLSPISDDVITGHPRQTPQSKANLLEVQKAVRARARLVVTKSSDGPTTVQMVPRLQGRRVDYGKN